MSLAVCRRETPADETAVLTEGEPMPADFSREEPMSADLTPTDELMLTAELMPTESPGVFVEQPLDRWSPRDLTTGLARLVRWSGAANVRSEAAS
jgi:hypothetical protein